MRLDEAGAVRACQHLVAGLGHVQHGPLPLGVAGVRLEQLALRVLVKEAAESGGNQGSPTWRLETL